MAPTEIEFVSRGYELDADGLVPPHVLLQYMEHMRWENARRNVSDAGSLMRADRSFVVAAQTLFIAGGIGMAVPMRGTVWIGRTGRTSMDFYHAIHRRDDSELLATGSAVIVCLDSGGAPSPLPDRLRRAGPIASWTVEPKPPDFPERPARMFELAYRVRAGDIDLLGHMNQAGYAALYEDALRNAIRSNACGLETLVGRRIRSLRIEYFRSTLPSEEVTVGTWLAANKPATAGFVMSRGGTLLSRAVACL